MSLRIALLGLVVGAGTAIAQATSSAAAATAASTAGMYNYALPVNGTMMNEFTRPFILAHAIAWPSFRYAYYMWALVGGMLVVWSLAYQFSGPGSGYLGAHFRKFAIRRVVLTGGGKPKDGAKKQKFRASSTYAQMIAIAALIFICFGLAAIGPDFIGAGKDCLTLGKCLFKPYKTPAIPGQIFFFLDGRPVANPQGYDPSMDPLLEMPAVDVYKSWWGAADRLGLVTYSMLPLCVSMGLKQWPFNIWASPWLINYHFDKTAILHRWSGRVIYLFSLFHVISWTIQLSIVRDPLGRVALVDAFTWWRFIGGCCAFVFLNLLMLLSIAKMRTKYYEAFYALHCATALGFLIAAAVHGGGVMSWAISAIGLWFLERCARLVILFYINKYSWVFGQSLAHRKKMHQYRIQVEREEHEKAIFTEKEAIVASPSSFHATPIPNLAYDPFQTPPDPTAGPRRRATAKKRSSYYAFGPGQNTSYLQTRAYPLPKEIPAINVPLGSFHVNAAPPRDADHLRDLHSESSIEDKAFPGYAVAQLLPGKTIRLSINVPSAVRWRPGQHVCLSIPGVRLLQGHCYTIANVDERIVGIVPAGGLATVQSKNTEVVLIIRAQGGFSKELWDHALKERKAKVTAGHDKAEIVKGVSMRTFISLPMGSAGRITWDDYESVVIMVGGTGITFGCAVLEYTCRKMANLSPVDRLEDRFKTQRIRFVWIVTEYSHLSWVAPTLRRCLEMLQPHQLQVDIYVSRDPREAERRAKRRSEAAAAAAAVAEARKQLGSMGDRVTLPDVDEAELSDSDHEDEGVPQRSAADIETNVENTDDLAIFEGEADHRNPAEAVISSQIRREGKKRRAMSRREQGFEGPATPKPRRTTRMGEQPLMATMDEEEEELLSPSARYAKDHLQAEMGGTESSSLVGKPSLRPLVIDSSATEPAKHVVMDGGVEIPMDLSVADQDDLEVISELARPGRPPITEIMDQEIDNSAGKTMVCCCGPVPLNTLIRNHVSDRIDLKKVRAGNLKGHVSLVAEDFSF